MEGGSPDLGPRPLRSRHNNVGMGRGFPSSVPICRPSQEPPAILKCYQSPSLHTSEWSPDSGFEDESSNLQLPYVSPVGHPQSQYPTLGWAVSPVTSCNFLSTGYGTSLRTSECRVVEGAGREVSHFSHSSACTNPPSVRGPPSRAMWVHCPPSALYCPNLDIPSWLFSSSITVVLVNLRHFIFPFFPF